MKDNNDKLIKDLLHSDSAFVKLFGRDNDYDIDIYKEVFVNNPERSYLSKGNGKWAKCWFDIIQSAYEVLKED